MRININQSDKIAAALAEAQGKRTARIFNAEEIAEIAKNAERDLERLGVPKSHRKGAQIRSNAGLVPNSYGYIAYTTEIFLERGGQDWFLISVETVHARGGRSTRSSIPQGAVSAVMRNKGWDVGEVPA